MKSLTKSELSVFSFVEKICMRPILILLLLVGAGIVLWLVLARPQKREEPEKQQAIVVSKHSASFNSALTTALNDYNKLSEQFVNWDSTAANATAQALIKDMENVPMNELQKDSSAIYETAIMFVDNVKGDAQTIANEKNIRPQREAFNSLTENFYQFLNTVRYDQQKLYLQECPMAFDDTKPGLWLSEKEEIRNPYLGLHHPTYGKGMISCGETKTELNNTGAK